jgi:hypothetical protein
MPPRQSLRDKARKAKQTRAEGRIPSLFSQLTIIEVNVESNHNIISKKLKEFDYDVIAEKLDYKLETLSAKILNTLTEEALKAVRSKVPVRSELLRNDHIKSKGEPFRRGFNTYYASREIYVDKRYHKPPYNTQQSGYTASGLAAFLDTGYNPSGQVLTRTRASIAERGYGTESARTPTQDWIGKAQRSFNSKRGRIISSFLQNL